MSLDVGHGDRGRTAVVAGVFLLGLFDPGCVVLVADDVHDVATTVTCARRLGLHVAPQSTGHAAGALGPLTDTILVRTARLDGIAIDADACPIGLIVEADETAFTTMMQNLLDNAVTFGRPGGIIRLSATRESATIALRIADDGPGVAEADLERILEPFEQAAASGEHDKGAGLGLTLVKAFAELEGGRLALSSAPGKGFAATVTLPPAS